MTAVQWAVAIMMFIGAVCDLTKEISTLKNSKEITSGVAALSIVIDLGIRAAYVFLLHAGGFW